MGPLIADWPSSFMGSKTQSAADYPSPNLKFDAEDEAHIIKSHKGII